jgi:PhnB protein
MIVAYLTFNGNTEEAFNFYKSVLGGDIISIQRFGDTPHGDQMLDSDKKKVMHVTLETPNGTLMGNDHMEFMGGPYAPGNNFSLSLHPKSEEEAKTLFDGLAKKGQVLMPLDKVFWGAYFGMLIDAFGVKWMVNFQNS